ANPSPTAEATRIGYKNSIIRPRPGSYLSRRNIPRAGQPSCRLPDGASGRTETAQSTASPTLRHVFSLYGSHLCIQLYRPLERKSIGGLGGRTGDIARRDRRRWTGRPGDRNGTGTAWLVGAGTRASEAAADGRGGHLHLG